jgi:hypothetical protein
MIASFLSKSFSALGALNVETKRSSSSFEGALTAADHSKRDEK